MARPHSPKDHLFQDHPASEGNLRLELFGALLTFQVRSAETNGAYTIFELLLPTNDSPIVMHVHPAAETFQVLDGELEFLTMRDDHPATFRATAADIVHIPPNVPHGFRSISASPALVQVVIAPGSMEGYFLELGTPTTKTTPSDTPMTPANMRRLEEVGRKYGIRLYDPD
jgi:quercetin dioxygenase-like cupin family protein